MRPKTLFAVIAICVAVPSAFAQKKPLDHSVYDSWKSIRGTSLSHDGKWIAYVIAPQEGDSTVEVKSTFSDKKFSFGRGSVVQFSNDSQYLVATVIPPLADVKKAIKDKVPAADMPKNSLLILNLATGDQTKIERVTSFQMPSEDSGWITYRPEVPAPPSSNDSVSGVNTNSASRPATGAGRRGGQATPSPAGSPLVIRNLTSGKEERIEDVSNAVLTKDGSVLAYSVVAKDGNSDGVNWLDLAKHNRVEVFKGKAKYPKIAVSDETKSLAFLTDKTLQAIDKLTNVKAASSKETTAKKNNLSLYIFNPKTAKTTRITGDNAIGFPRGWIISENSPLSFSEKGSRILFGTAPAPVEAKKDDTPESEKVSVDVWTWQDKKIMPEQLLQIQAEQRRTYKALAFVESGKVVQLETKTMPSVEISRQGEGEFALGVADGDYQLMGSWEEGFSDYYVVNVQTGQARKLLQRSEASISFSPNGEYIGGYDPETKQYFVSNPSTLGRTNFKIPTVLYDELEDRPSTARPYGEAGWTKGDASLLVYDTNDVWAIDPTGKHGPRNVTGSAGRMSNLRFRYVNTYPDAKSIDPEKPFLLSAFNQDTKTAGFYSINLQDLSARPVKLIAEDKLYSTPIVAKSGNVMSYTRQDFVEFPDVWIAKGDFSERRKISNANPQQAQYNWGTAELVNWISGDGQRLQGILIKPENFTYGKKYPMITYFYERLSDTLHAYRPPAPSASTVNMSYFASNGYVMFIPDIPYKEGYPGESSVSAIVSGVLSIVNRGYVDPSKLGIQGHSWGGYAVAYLVTRTNLFHCACAGAAVADMFSAYGGIRYGTGVLREGQYEHGQSRIGASIWDKPLRYLENSPLFWLDKVQTPLLMMHNDKDGAVPFTQGIELFSGLRRLGKPAWMCVYNGEDHNLVERKNRKDWSIRLSQYFDHFLKEAPMPIWMSKGVPATEKGKTFGFELGN